VTFRCTVVKGLEFRKFSPSRQSEELPVFPFGLEGAPPVIYLLALLKGFCFTQHCYLECAEKEEYFRV
jgi:hypothetical protein